MRERSWGKTRIEGRGGSGQLGGGEVSAGARARPGPGGGCGSGLGPAQPAQQFALLTARQVGQ